MMLNRTYVISERLYSMLLFFFQDLLKVPSSTQNFSARAQSPYKLSEKWWNKCNSTWTSDYVLYISCNVRNVHALYHFKVPKLNRSFRHGAIVTESNAVVQKQKNKSVRCKSSHWKVIWKKGICQNLAKFSK